jgi:D-glycero-alpha-D-manno-heptose-7-phosphate kinase
MIISRTPFRISFFGGGTDFPAFYEEHGGAVLLTTINKYCYISLHALSPFFKHKFRASYAKTESVIEPSEFEHPLIRETLLQLNVKQGLEISHVADLPGRTGLGSSSSFTVGLLHALHVFHGQRVTAEDLAREAILIERERIGDAGGHQDQYAAAYGGLIRLDFSTNRKVSVRHLTLSTSRLSELEDHMMLFYTGLEQSAEEILHEQQKRTKINTLALLQMKELVGTAESILTSQQPLKEFGQLLHESWNLKKGLSSGISNTAINNAYEAAQRSGAWGGKLLGAGGRGFLLLLAPPECHDLIRASLSTLQEVSIACSATGSEIIFRTPQL